MKIWECLSEGTPRKHTMAWREKVWHIPKHCPHAAKQLPHKETASLSAQDRNTTHPGRIAGEQLLLWDKEEEVGYQNPVLTGREDTTCNPYTIRAWTKMIKKNVNEFYCLDHT